MADPLLQVDMLQAGYGQSTVLDGLSFSMGTESVAIIGRNGEDDPVQGDHGTGGRPADRWFSTATI